MAEWSWYPLNHEPHIVAKLISGNQNSTLCCVTDWVATPMLRVCICYKVLIKFRTSARTGCYYTNYSEKMSEITSQISFPQSEFFAKFILFQVYWTSDFLISLLFALSSLRFACNVIVDGHSKEFSGTDTWPTISLGLSWSYFNPLLIQCIQ